MYGTTKLTFNMIPDYISSRVFQGGALEVLAWIFSMICLWTIFNALAVSRKRPAGITVFGPSLLLGKWISSLVFTWKGLKLIQHAYRESVNQELFAIPGLAQYQVLVSHPEQIQELAASNPNVLSFNAAMNNRLFEKQTMFGFEFGGPDPHNSVANRAIKVLLGTHLKTLMPKIRQRVVQGIEGQLRHVIPCNDGSKRLKVESFARAVTMQVNTQILFGDELASNEAFQKSCLRYSWHGGITAEISRQIPRILARPFGLAAMACSGTMRFVAGCVTDLIDRRVLAESQGKATQYLDVTQFVIRSSRTSEQRTQARLVQQMMALLFAISHQTPMAVAWGLTMLAANREYIYLLRAEIQRLEKQSEGLEFPLDKLRIMDSFLRETSRLNPLDGLNTQRMALKGFTFSNGAHIPAGNLVAVPQHAIMRDENIYSDPERFDGFRFYTPEVELDRAASTKYTDVKWDYPYWGSPNHACPGRWYASYLQKQVLVYILKNYDFEILDLKNATKPFVWTTAAVPKHNTEIAFTAREQKLEVGSNGKAS